MATVQYNEEELLNQDPNNPEVGTPTGGEAAATGLDAIGEYFKTLNEQTQGSAQVGSKNIYGSDIYYPGLAQNNVLRGQMSSPMGSMSLFSAGAPLFPIEILDAYEREKRAYSDTVTKAINKELLTPLDELKETEKLKLNYERWNRDWTTKYYEGIGALIDEFNAMPVMSNRRTEYRKKLDKYIAKMSAQKESLDVAYKAANEIVNAKSGTLYISPKQLESANKILSMDLNDYKSLDEFIEATRPYQKDLIQVASLQVTTVNDIAKMSAFVSENIDPTKVKGMSTNITDVYSLTTATGLNAVDKKTLETILKTGYEDAYASFPENIRPSFEQYQEYIIPRVTQKVEKDIQTISKDNLWEDLEVWKQQTDYVKKWTNVDSAKMKIFAYGKAQNADVTIYPPDVYKSLEVSFDPKQNRVIDDIKDGTIPGVKNGIITGSAKLENGEVFYVIREKKSTSTNVGIGESTPKEGEGGSQNVNYNESSSFTLGDTYYIKANGSLNSLTNRAFEKNNTTINQSTTPTLQGTTTQKPKFN